MEANAAALVTFNVESKIVAPLTSNVEANAAALVTFNVESKIVAPLTSKDDLRVLAPLTTMFPFNDISFVTITS